MGGLEPTLPPVTAGALPFVAAQWLDSPPPLTIQSPARYNSSITPDNPGGVEMIQLTLEERVNALEETVAALVTGVGREKRLEKYCRDV